MTKLEFEDKTPVSKLHADIIVRRREERLAKLNSKTIDVQATETTN